MSRIGNRVLTIPAGVEVNVNGNNITVKGPKGTLEYTFRNNVEVKVEDGKITVTRKDDSKVSKQLHGTTNSNINNMLIGVSEGFKKELEINGVGYRFQLQGNKLVVTAGYSHTVEMVAPEGVKMEMPEKSQTELIISGYDKQAVSEFAANIREIRKPEPYKGKGIKYKDEHIRRKEGKKAA
jgi:large subunit ribosomal protein L6